MNKTQTNNSATFTTLDEAMNGRSSKNIVIPSIKKLTRDWVEASKGQFGFGGNDNSMDLFNVCVRLIDTQENNPFAVSDFILLSVYLDVSRDVVTEFFNRWISFLKASSRIKIISAKDSAYEWDTYYFLA